MQTHPPVLPEPGHIDVLFVAYGGGHISMVLPVAQRLAAQGIRLSIFALTTAIPAARASGLPWFSYGSLPQARDPAAIAHGKALAAQMPLNDKIPLNETEAYLGCNMLDLIAEHGNDQATAMYHDGGRSHFFPLRTISALCKHLQPKVLVATNSPRSEKAAITAAGRLGIASVCMVDMFALQTVEWLKSHDYATRVCVLNEQVRDLFLRKGRPPKDVVVTGNPAFDMLRAPETITAGQRLRTLRGWDQGRSVLLYASAPETAVHVTTGAPADPLLPRKVEDHLRHIVAHDPTLELVIRRHPSEDQTVQTASRISQSTSADALDPLLHAVDVVIVTCSTVGFQGHIAGRPVLSVECSAVSPNVPYGAFGIARAVQDIPSIGDALKHCVADAKHDATTADHAAPSATAAVVTQIMSLLDGAQ